MESSAAGRLPEDGESSVLLSLVQTLRPPLHGPPSLKGFLVLVSWRVLRAADNRQEVLVLLTVLLTTHQKILSSKVLIQS